MGLTLRTPHRLASYNYSLRTGAFAFCFLTFGVLWIERGQFGALNMAATGLVFLIYPHLAYLHACLAKDSKAAELHNLYADAVLLGAWSAQVDFALWPTAGMLLAVCLNGAGHGYIRRLAWTLGLFCAGALAWGLVTGFEFRPDTGPVVTAACFLGIMGYVSWLGLRIYTQNHDLVQRHRALLASEEHFRFIADNVADLVAMVDTKGHFLFASSAHAGKFRAASVEKDADWTLLVHPDDQAEAWAFLRAIVSSGEPRSLFLRLVLASGTWDFMECKGKPVLDEKNRTTAIVLVCNNINQFFAPGVDPDAGKRAAAEQFGRKH